MITKEFINPNQMLLQIGVTKSTVDIDGRNKKVTLEIPDWLVVHETGGKENTLPISRVALDASLRAAIAVGAEKSHHCGLIRIAIAKRTEEEAARAKAGRKKKQAAYEKRRKESMAAWTAAGLNADRCWKQHLQWSHEPDVIALAAVLAKLDPFYAGGHKSFEREAGFSSPLSFPRTQVAMQMAWGTLPSRDSWRDVAARVGVTVR